MKLLQKLFIKNKWKEERREEGFDTEKAQLVLAFCGKELLNDENISAISQEYPNAAVISATTAGEVFDDCMYESSISLTAIQLEKSEIKIQAGNISSCENSFELGASLMSQVEKKDLKYVMVLSDGNLINGSELVEGFRSANVSDVLITGGLAGDGDSFESTLVGVNGDIKEGNVVLIGFYGNNIKVGHGSVGGWESFGHERTITKAEKNVLFELDGKCALKLYKEYLGDYANELPSSALLFPLSISVEGDTVRNVRTILSIDEEKQSMTFAGNMPVGNKVRLMKANFDKLIDAVSGAAENALDISKTKPELAILISCVGRKLVLNERVEEELEKAKEIFGDEAFLTGFYSYGEISPMMERAKCELMNQTMTITTLTEI
ncbi:FIST signal transduction protein [Arcticibacterium luteifluviistationis]|uniref:Histidine kinase n=1 Tax=Arcticibacterium luteifluviistationis TaxID=1784714 RepID=A0A2Z4GDJ6_9BACT|nr:FIST N-terminal domain-containing protein [Arcticibacterium luteifluviistationis]AWV99095.1 histidine kinase [Arcticibacterium luteifluviistationis]